MDATSTCGCCSGTDASTPQAIDNRPGLSAIAYRIGRHPDFKESLLARLSSADLPALAGLQTRSDEDFTIALCDAFATMADVLTFYQERIANENYLRTSIERRSILELARLIGYELAPGVAAGTHLAFTLEDAPGAREHAARPVAIPVGTKVQSVPGPNEQPVTFETVEEIEARWQWNAMGAQVLEPAVLQPGDRDLYLRGADLNLRPADILLLVSPERFATPKSDRWDVRMLRSVEPDRERGLTRVTWQEALANVAPAAQPVAEGFQAYVFRLRASLFGHNAPDARMFNTTGTNIPDLLGADGKSWKDFVIKGSDVDLDSAYPTIAPKSWLLLVSQIKALPSSFPGFKELYRVDRVTFLSRTDYGMSGRITRITPDSTENFGIFGLRETVALAESEPLTIADRPILYPVYGDELALDRLAPELQRDRPVAVAGKRLKVRVVSASGSPALTGAGGVSVPLDEGDVFGVMTRPAEVIAGAAVTLAPADLLPAMASSTRLLRWRLVDRDGVVGDVDILGHQLVLEPSVKEDPVISEIALIADTPVAVSSDRDRTTLTFAAPLTNVYDRSSVVVNANVAAATHGETVKESLGSGDASARDQRFALKQSPLTYVSAPTSSGRASTLEVRVNDLLWKEVPSLYGYGPRDRVYETTIDDAAVTTVQFGDGEGAPPPSGQENIRAKYRLGLGSAGNVRARQLSTLMGGVLGVKSAINPEPATGGEDPERVDNARRNAPISVLTLERIVSRRDYEDYARGYPGIDKAQALWVPWGSARGVFVSVAGPDGAEVLATSATYTNLLTSLRLYGDPLLPLQVKSYTPVTFSLKASLKVADDVESSTVLAQVESVLRTRFAFAVRDFGQPVTIDEVIAVVHEVPGVVAVDVDELYRNDPGASPSLEKRLIPQPASVSVTGMMTPAELLVLDPTSLKLGVMP
jgi:hypothetical protein